jgi:hypothetical protein
MAESALGSGIENNRQIDKRRNALAVVSLCVKAIVVLFPLPTAFFSGAPTEMKFLAVYATVVTLALFLALSEIAGGLHRLTEAVDRQRRSS